MQSEMTRDIAFLLAEAAAAHEQYEEAMLRGHRDTDMPEWCAEHAMANGLAALLDYEVTEQEVGELLRIINEEYVEVDGQPPWAEFAARRLVGALEFAHGG
ncbi:MAG: hypothetical protein ACYTKD_12090 [Planctomycetota bacterium]